MAPPTATNTSTQSSKRYARLAGSAMAGVIELFGFHPVDTVAKRMMANESRVGSTAQLNSVIFRHAANNPSLLSRYASLFPGLSFAAAYKILQRIYKFGGQPAVVDRLQHSCSWNKNLIHAAAGSVIGVGEIVLLPLDVLKIKSQNNPESLRGRGLIGILRTEKLSTLYAGAGWTAARNAPGSFALFGGSALVKGKVFGLENYSSATFGQNFVASVAGGVASITVASPLDVVKTRIQMADFASQQSGATVIRNIIVNEGPGAFFKGLVPKLLIVGPKLVFSFTIAQTLVSKFEEILSAAN